MPALTDFYARLELARDASPADIKSAYRKLAKEAHPDTGSLNDGGSRFRELKEAYEVLSDPERRAEYDADFESAQAGGQKRDRAVEPVRCSKCSEITAQPRYILLWRVWSALIVNARSPIQGIYCSICARRAALGANIFSGLLGWWSVWGLATTPVAVVGNAFGGKKFPDIEEKLLFKNLLAFMQRGELKIAAGLAGRLITANNSEIRDHVADIIAALRSSGVPIEKLKNPWNARAGHVSASAVCLLLVPVALASWIHVETSRSPAPAPSASDGSPGADSSTEDTASAEVAGPASAPCLDPPKNGQRIGGSLKRLKGNHILEIDNGTNGDAIVKLRDAETRAVRYSFFVARGEKAKVSKIPDGAYVIQYALGERLNTDCRSFLHMRANEIPRVVNLQTTREETDGRVRIGYSELSYTLYAVPGGNIRPEEIDPSAFNK